MGSCWGFYNSRLLAILKGQWTPWKSDAPEDVLKSKIEAVQLEILIIMQVAKVLRCTVLVGVEFQRRKPP